MTDMHPNSVTISSGTGAQRRGRAVSSGSSLMVSSSLRDKFNVAWHDRGFGFDIGDARNVRPGVSVTCDVAGSEVRINTDVFGTEPLRYRADAGGFAVSNRLEELRVPDTRLDVASLYQYLIGGYFVGSSTLYHDVHQTLCSQCLHFRGERDAYKVDESVRAWSARTDDGQDLNGAIERASSEVEGTALMMSAGWDSRTLLCAADPRAVVAYTHGDTSSRELAIAKRITGDLRLDHLFVDTRNNPITVELLEEMLRELGSAMFPLWYIACRNIQALWARPMSSGILGEVLGGHWDADAMLGSRGRLNSVLKFAGRNANANLTIDAICRMAEPSRDLWYLTEEAHRHVTSHASDLVDRVRAELTRYGPDTTRAVEQFMAKNRARHYLLGQAHCAKPFSGYVLPFADEGLLRTVLTTPPLERLHNKLNRRALSTIAPQLLRYPMSATLCTAARPIAVQEASRALRLVRERTTGKSNFGWFNYDSLQDSSFFDDAIDSLESSLWDKKAIRENVAAMKARRDHLELGYTLNTITKLKTVDHLVAGVSI